jgi:hypothetical protein
VVSDGQTVGDKRIRGDEKTGSNRSTGDNRNLGKYNSCKILSTYLFISDFLLDPLPQQQTSQS